MHEPGIARGFEMYFETDAPLFPPRGLMLVQLDHDVRTVQLIDIDIDDGKDEQG